MDLSTTAATYRRWGETEARGVSELYEDWALSISADVEALDLISRLDPGKRQPNLVFGSSRVAGVPLERWSKVRNDFMRNWAEIRQIAETHSTQTNEAARCATLLPAFALIDGPIALIEVGASAGLCLFPDRYSYRYHSESGIKVVDPADGPSQLVIDCSISRLPVPTELPRVVWRAGIDLNPLDATSRDDIDWLDALIWPEHEDRRKRLRTAAELVAMDPPNIIRGDLNARIASVVNSAPDDVTVVVFHTAVLAYVSEDARGHFRHSLASLGARWISNEAPVVLPDIAARASVGPSTQGEFVLALDGDPVAYTSPHGRYVRSAR